MKISFGKSEEAWLGFEDYLIRNIRKYEVKSICEIGGGANPVLNQIIIKKFNLDYSILDISQEELEKVSDDYDKIKRDITSTNFNLNRKFDLIISKMLAEHISDAKQFHKNTKTILKKNGLAIHFFPTLYSPPFLLNLLIPNDLSKILLNFFSPRNNFYYPKFPAYYQLCRGPIKSQLKIFKDFGYKIMEYKYFFGHGYYEKIRFLKIFQSLILKFLLKHPIPLFSSFSWLLLKKK
ncbi:putative methyltransferase, type 11 [Desulfosarcina variabilis str. Montpellier]|uniref:methyltransferase domain-containing protein n=1 Tax=Desulfosarcina variabilis TaxID=2300 RepID=UPI003AFA1AE7